MLHLVERALPDLPYVSLCKGLYMTFALMFLSQNYNYLIVLSSLLVLLVNPKYNILFYAFFSLFWPFMEIIIIHYSDGNAWVYPHANIINIPLYIFPLWAIVSECVLDIYEWGVRRTIW